MATTTYPNRPLLGMVMPKTQWGWPARPAREHFVLRDGIYPIRKTGTLFSGQGRWVVAKCTGPCQNGVACRSQVAKSSSWAKDFEMLQFQARVTSSY
jgi:hypothetical protein